MRIILLTIVALLLPASLAIGACNTYTLAGCTYAQKWHIRGAIAVERSDQLERESQERRVALAIAKEEAKIARDERRRCNSYHGCGKDKKYYD